MPPYKTGARLSGSDSAPALPPDSARSQSRGGAKPGIHKRKELKDGKGAFVVRGLTLWKLKLLGGESPQGAVV